MARVSGNTNSKLVKLGIPGQCKPTIQRSQSLPSIRDIQRKVGKIDEIQSTLKKAKNWKGEIKNSGLTQTDKNIFKELYNTLCKGNLADNICTMCNEAGIDLLHTPNTEIIDYIISKMVQDYFLEKYKSTPLVKWPEGADIVPRPKT